MIIYIGGEYCKNPTLTQLNSKQLNAAWIEVISLLDKLQCPQSEEKDSVAMSCGFCDESQDLRVQTC